MSLHRKDKIRNWSVRIILLAILLPIATLATVRYAGWLRMRKTDKEIKAFLSPHQVTTLLDTLKLRGRDIIYLKTSSGEPKEDALVLIHGSPGSMDAFLDYMVDTALLARADIIAYDRPGYGNSGFGLSEPLLLRQGEIVEQLMRELGYKKYWLAGHSYGGAVVLQVAIRHPERMNGIAMIAGSVSPAEEPASEAWRKWLDLPLLRELLPVSLKVSNEEQMPLHQNLTMIEDDWDRLTMPVSLVHGEKDVIVSYNNLYFAQQKLVNADTVFVKTFENENHFIPWTQQKTVVEELVKLMDRKPL